MSGRKIPHPASTRFDDDTAREQPLKKRLKRNHGGAEARLRSESGSEAGSPESDAVLFVKPEIPDSEDDETDGGLAVHRLTELENALPQVDTDKDAIARYESLRLNEDIPDDLKTRLNGRTWIRRRSSIYVDAFDLALGTILEDEGHLFDEKEMQVFQQWRNLDYEAQYLYVRLFLRKTSAWHRIQRLGYHSDISDLPAAAKLLQQDRNLPLSSAVPQKNPGESTPRQEFKFESSFQFADDSDAEITSLEEALSLLNLEEVKSLAKEAKVKGKNKGGLIKALKLMSCRQTGLGWAGLKRSESEMSTGSNEAADNCSESEGYDPFEDENRDKHFLRKILALTGPAIRLSLTTLKLFERVHLVFYRSTEWTEKSLTTIILTRISRCVFPEYIVCRSANIFDSRSSLLEFEAALRTQFRVDSILEFNGNPNKEGLQQVLAIFEEVLPRWKALVLEEQKKEDSIYHSGEGAYLRRFSPAWIYTRIVHKGTNVLGKLKMHEDEHEVLTELLNQRLFHAARRGAWYQRKALLEEHYMAAIQPRPEIKDSEQQKRYWKRMALKTCETGLQDNDCHLIFHYDLQKRIKKLEKNIKIAKREQHDFGHVSLAKPFERVVEGVRIHKKSASSGYDNRKAEHGRSTKTIWIDEREGGGECSVEDMCLSWYRNQGWKGFHSESGIIRTLFAYLFFDILFVYIPNVFQTAYQTCPLDLHTDAFFPSRASEINHRLVEITNGEAERIMRAVDEREREKQTCVIGLNWGFELEDLLEIVRCFEGASLATICQVMAQEYRNRGGGVPDLFLFKPGTKEIMFSEVKSVNDRLSDTQRLWVHVLTGAGIRVELCNAVEALTDDAD